MLIIGDVLRRAAQRFPSKLAVICADRQITYASLNASANQIAQRLLLETPETAKIGIMLRNRAEYASWFFGIMKAGRIAVPISARYVPAEVSQIDEELNLDGIVVSNQTAEVVQQTSFDGRIYNVDAADLYGSDLRDPGEPSEELDENQIALIASSGGTTGVPKPIAHTHRTISIWTYIACIEMNFNENDVTLHSAPFFHGAALISHLISFTRVGGTHVIADGFRPSEFLRLIEQNRVTHFFATPSMLIDLLSAPDFGEYDKGSLRKIMYSSAPIPPSVAIRLAGAFPGVALYQTYGLMEVGWATILKPIDYERKYDTVGRICMDVDVKIVNPDDPGQAAAAGQPGEIMVRNDCLMTEYYRRESATDATIVDGWVRTGDLGWFDEDGFLHLTGRKKDVIISGGENIYPKEIEDVLHEHPAVREAAVVGLPDERWGQSVAAAVISRAPDLTAEELVEFCRGRMARYKVPKRIVFFQDFPRAMGGQGKILKREIVNILTAESGGERSQ